MSTIAITFNTQALDFSPLVRGTITVVYNDGNQDFALQLQLTTGVSTFGNFTEVAWIDGVSGEDDQQAQNFATAFNRDYSLVGGQQSGPLIGQNLTAVAVDNTVTITAANGTFVDGASAYTGNVLIVNGFTVNNSTQTTPTLLSVSTTGTGTCDTVQYSITATGGNDPYTLSSGQNVISTNWDGSEILYNFDRGTTQTIQVLEPSPSLLLLDEITIIVPRKLAAGEFTTTINQFETYSDILVTNTNPVNGTTPLEYSLDAEGSTTGGSYQTENVFTGVFPGLYELFIKDVYGCEVSKTIEISSFQDASQDQTLRYFDIMQANALIFSECPTFNESVKKNFDNTLSWNELSGLNYEANQKFTTNDVVGTQFKSSYPVHQITLHRCGLSPMSIFPVRVQKNIGSKEKVDCKFFELNGKTAVYFDGGNEYEPDTTTVIGASEYTQFTPVWAEEGQIVFLEGLGGFTIESTGYDSDLGKGYFVVNVQTSQTEGKVQVTRNIQDYNLFEFYLPISQIQSTGRIVVEKGFAENKMDGNPWVSELITKTVDTDETLLIEASSTKNRADLVFQSGISFKNRIEGVFRPFFEGDVENFDGDSRIYPLTENLYQRYRLELDRLTSKQVYKYCIWCLLDGFAVNNVSLRATKFPEIEPNGDSNYYSFKVDLGYTGNIVAVQQDEIVLNVSTGLEGGASNSILPPPLVYDGKTRLVVDGGFFTTEGEFISV